MLRTQLITTDPELAALESSWNDLSGGVPFRSWNWLATWWRHYGVFGRRTLHVIAVSDDDVLIGVAPWYLEESIAKGNVIRALGDGQVCTDHVSLVCRPADAGRAATAVAECLAANQHQWDRMELTAVDAGDVPLGMLVRELESRDCLVAQQPAGNCWVLTLPASWDEFTRIISQSHRRQLRRCRETQIDSHRVRWHRVHAKDELEPAWNVLQDLHQRRRNGLGEPGCFASPTFCGFHREVVERLLAAGQLRMSWTELDGQPFTAEYHVAGPDTVYVYQSGMDTSRLHDSPGRLAYVLCIEQAITEGFRHFDFLRGDEPYKAHWRARPMPQWDYWVFPNRRTARLRGRLTGAGATLKAWLKQGVAAARR